MQVTELSAEGLKREYKVVVEAAEIERRVSQRLAEIKKTIKMPGFRPGKVPLPMLKRQYGKSVIGEVLEQAVNEGSKQAIDTNELKPALRPKIEVTAFDEGADLEFSMAVEVLPEVPPVEYKAIKLTRYRAEVQDESVDKALTTFASRMQDFAPPDEPRPSAAGDRVTIDFQGTVDGELFEGGSAEGYAVVLGSGSMIPGFEDQLIGVAAGEDKVVEVTFPETYGKAELAGKAASFAVKLHQVEAPQPVTVDDDFAKRQGLDDLAALKTVIQDGFAKDYERYSRAKIKRQLLDHLAEHYRFEVPPGMVDLEFETIWKQVEAELAKEQTASGKSEDELKAEYRQIAERRVRLGLILSEIGQANELKVEQQELNQAVMEQLQRFPGQEKQVLEYFKQNPQAIDQLRAPIYEDKVVDFILEMAEVTEETVTPEELMRDPDEDGAADGAGDDSVGAGDETSTAKAD